MRASLLAASCLMIILAVAPSQARALVANCSHTYAISSSSWSVAEGEAVTISVVESVTPNGGGSSCAAGSVDYGTSDGTAKAPADYTATSGTLSFDALPNGGQQSKAFQVQTVADAAATTSVDFNVALSNPQAGSGNPAFLDSPSSATVTINDGSPTARTGAARNVTGVFADLTGTVNPAGRATDYYFDWGLTDAYGNSTPFISAGGGNQEEPASLPQGGLKPDTLYHFRLVATNAAGSGNGADATFLTGPKIRISGLPKKKRCTRARRLPVTVQVTSGVELRGTTVRLDGRKVASGKRPKLRARLKPRKLKAGRHTVAVASRIAGARSTKKARFRVCRR